MGYALLSAADSAGVTLLGRLSGRENAGSTWGSTVTGFAGGTVWLLPQALLQGLLPDVGRSGWTPGRSSTWARCRRCWRTRCSSSASAPSRRPRLPWSPRWSRSPQRSSASCSSASGPARWCSAARLLLFAVLFLAAAEGAGRAASGPFREVGAGPLARGTAALCSSATGAPARLAARKGQRTPPRRAKAGRSCVTADSEATESVTRCPDRPTAQPPHRRISPGAASRPALPPTNSRSLRGDPQPH